MKKGDKQAVSAVVATVLIILITVAAVSIIWVAILPMISENVDFNEELVDLTINTYGGYSLWDDVNEEVCVQVKRGSDDADLEGIKVVFSIAGNSFTGTFLSNNIPGVNEAKTQCFSGLASKPESAKVIPVFSDGEGVVTSEVPGSKLTIGDSTGQLSTPIEGVAGTYDYYLDFDGDSYGDALNSIENGSAPAGYVGNPYDCDDTNASINPGADENYNNGIDENCDGGDNLNDCGTLNVENAVYFLDNSKTTTGTCFTIAANNITLDMKGKTIRGDATGYGVYVFIYNDTKIRNGEIYDFNLGVYLYSSSNNDLINIIANSNNYGINTQYSSNNNLTSITTNSNSQGIRLAIGSNNKINLVSACGNVWLDFSGQQSTGISGAGNKFGNETTDKVLESLNNGWPVLGTNYINCLP